MKLNLHPIQSNRFGFNPQTGVIYAEASDFNGINLRSQIYDDACDVGLAIQSSVTGVVITYHLSQEETKDGEVTAWKYLPVPEDVRKHPECAGTSVTIFND
jgi:hypothetical protein